MKIAVFWDVAMCNVLEVYNRFRCTYCLHHQGALMLESVSTYETLVMLNETTRRTITEDSRLQTRCRWKLKSHLCCYDWNSTWTPHSAVILSLHTLCGSNLVWVNYITYTCHHLIVLPLGTPSHLPLVNDHEPEIVHKAIFSVHFCLY